MSADVSSSLLLPKSASVGDVHVDIEPAGIISSPSLHKSNSTAKVIAKTKETLSNARVGRNYKFLQNQWTEIKENSSLIDSNSWISSLKKSNRRDIDDSDNKPFKVNAIWDIIRYGICKKPSLSYNPYVQTSLIRAAIQKDEDDDDKEQKDHSNTIGETLPIYNGGHQVTLRSCDRNKFVFPLPAKEWITSWLSFDVYDDNLLTSSDTFIGAVSIDLSGIKVVGKSYYTQLPLINKHNVSKQLQMQNKKGQTPKDWMKSTTKAVKSQLLSPGLKSNKSPSAGHEYSRVPSDTKMMDSNISNGIGVKMDEIIDSHKHLNITGVVHVKVRKTVDDLQNVFTNDQIYNLELEILAVSNMTTLKTQGMDTRRLWWGILIFVLYLVVYSVTMFLAELHTDTGMNDYREALWFSFITVTTLGYGDVYGFVGELVGYVVNSGEQSLNDKMDRLMAGAHDAYKHKQEAKIDEINKDKSPKQRSQSAQLKSKDVAQMLKNDNRRSSEPFLSAIDEKKDQMNKLDLDDEKVAEEEEEKNQQRAAVVEAVEVETAKTSKLKLDELQKLHEETKSKLRRNICINICLLIIVALFGFFVMGIALLLDGPNWLTANGYSCTDHSDPHCQKDHSKMIVDSLYYVIVSMSTVGYGDIYPLFPEQAPLARVWGAIFILFGTLMLVRILDIVSGYMIWKQNMSKKRKTLMRLLSSSSEFLDEFDLNGDGIVTRYEFFVGMLIQLDIVSSDRVNEIMAIFYNADKNGDGVVDAAELKLKVAEDHLKLKWGENAWSEIDREWRALKDEQKKLKEDKVIFERKKKEWKEQKGKYLKEIKELKAKDVESEKQIEDEEDIS